MKQGVLNLFHSNRLSAPGRRGRRCVACRRAFATATKSDSEPRAKRAAGPRERAVPLPDFPLRLRRGSACPRSSAEPHPLQRRHALQPLTPAVVLKNARLPARGSERASQRPRKRNQIGFGAASEAGRRSARASGPAAAACSLGRAGKRKTPGRTAHSGRRSCELRPPGARLRTRVATTSQPQPNRIRSRERSGPQARVSERSHCGRFSLRQSREAETARTNRSPRPSFLRTPAARRAAPNARPTARWKRPAAPPVRDGARLRAILQTHRSRPGNLRESGSGKEEGGAGDGTRTRNQRLGRP